jgi:hypothetical protein
MVGTLTAADFTASGPVTTFAEAVAAIQAGTTYFNIHTAANPGGEIRGQIADTVAAPAPTPAPTPGATAAATVPPTSTLGVEPASGGSAVPAVIGVLGFLALVSVASLRFAPRRTR